MQFRGGGGGGGGRVVIVVNRVDNMSYTTKRADLRKGLVGR